MSVIPASVKCDGCGKNRQEDGNHWLTMWLDEREFHFQRGASVNDQGRHCCGAACASKLFARWLSTGKLDET